MKKMIVGSIAVVSVIIGITIYFLNVQSIDTKYAINYSKVIGSYDITKLDRYLNESTTITYKGVTKTYKELRPNVATAFNDKIFKMEQGSSYGYGDKFINGILEIAVNVFVTFENQMNFDDETVYMKLSQEGIYKFGIKSLEGNGAFFGYLFFGILE